MVNGRRKVEHGREREQRKMSGEMEPVRRRRWIDGEWGILKKQKMKCFSFQVERSGRCGGSGTV